jgi:predicted transport protein
MSSVEKAQETQLKNIQTKTGKTLVELSQLIQASGLTKHGEIRGMLQRNLGLGYGDANALVHALSNPDGERAAQAQGASTDEVVDEIYRGPKADLRPIHDALMNAIYDFGEFEIAPKKGYVSLRRKKQFAMIGPATKTQVEVGLNVKGLPDAERLTAVPAGGMCNYKVRLSNLADVDSELLGWIRQAYESAG